MISFEEVINVFTWVQEHWLPLTLSAEIVGAAVAIKMGLYRKGIIWLVMAVLTIWLGGAI